MIMENEDKVEKIRLLQENIEEIKEKLNVSNHRLETAQHKISLLEGENDSICKLNSYFCSDKAKIARVYIFQAKSTAFKISLILPHTQYQKKSIQLIDG